MEKLIEYEAEFLEKKIVVQSKNISLLKRKTIILKSFALKGTSRSLANTEAFIFTKEKNPRLNWNVFAKSQK